MRYFIAILIALLSPLAHADFGDVAAQEQIANDFDNLNAKLEAHNENVQASSSDVKKALAVLKSEGVNYPIADADLSKQVHLACANGIQVLEITVLGQGTKQIINPTPGQISDAKLHCAMNPTEVTGRLFTIGGAQR